MGIALGMRDAGSGVIEMISDFDQPDQATEFAMIRRLAEASGRPLSLSLAQAHRAPDGWRGLLQRIDDAAADGVQIRGQVAPRAIGLLLGLQASLNPFSGLPSYKAIAGESFEARLAALRDAGFRRRLLAEADQATTADPRNRMLNFKMMFRLGEPVNYEPPEDDALAHLAARQGVSAASLAYDLLLEDDGRQFPLFALRQLRPLQSRCLRRHDRRREHGDGAGRWWRPCRHHRRCEFPDLPADPLGAATAPMAASISPGWSSARPPTLPGPSGSTIAA
ncbi:MAG: hypothetical protein WDN69_30875 [Aliidongia sp.]